jgi:nitrite reductase/ring-hydroxylating ferredoxin subunit
MAEHTIQPASRIREGQVLCFEIAGRRLAVGRTARGYFALDDRCPHAGGSLGEGEVDGENVLCPIHGHAYDSITGEGLDDGAEVQVHPCRLDGDVLRIQLGSDTEDMEER